MSKTIPLLLKKIANTYPKKNAQLWKDSNGEFKPTTFSKLYQEAQQFAAGISKLGIIKNSHVGLISENRREWFITDLGVQCAGAVDVPRGCDSTADEIAYILEFAECAVTILENEQQLKKIVEVKKKISKVKHLIIFDFPEDIKTYKKELKGISFHTFSDIMDSGMEVLKKDPSCIEKIIDQGDEKDLSTIIFTSGTTGEPKGVMIRHEAFLNQVLNVPKMIKTGSSDIWLCVLPVWHSFERIMQYVALGAGSALAYSKPIGQILIADMATVKPTWMASVPRIWESVQAGVYRNVNASSAVKKGLFHFFVSVSSAHAKLSVLIRGLSPKFRKRFLPLDFLIGFIPYLLLFPLRLLGNLLVFGKIKKKLGGRFVAGISGGGALPAAVDNFFAAAGILLLEGYGLTETAPVLGVRKQKRPVPGTVGPVFPNMEVKIVDENGNTLRPGNKGLVMAKGVQIMSGYLKKEEETAKVLGQDGWLNTGDLGMLTWDNHLKIVGRAKDTIVLMGGENIEPNPIEEKIQESPYIAQSMVVGQDKKVLGALIVVDKENCDLYFKEHGKSRLSDSDFTEDPELRSLITSEIKEAISRKNGFKVFEYISKYKILLKPFEIGDELSQKQEIKRFIIQEKYDKDIQKLLS